MVTRVVATDAIIGATVSRPRGSARGDGRRKPVTKIDDPRLVKAFGHPLRVRILAMLDERTASPRDLAELLDTTLGTVSYHVRLLHELELLELVRTSQVRGAIAHHYRARPRPRATDEAWEEAGPIVKQATIGATLQTIDAYARASAAAGGFDHPGAQLSRSTVRLDDRGWKEAARACEKLLLELARIETAAGRRIDKNGGEAREAAVAVMLFNTVRLTE